MSADAVTTVMAAGFQIAVTCDARGLWAREHPFGFHVFQPVKNQGAGWQPGSFG